MGTKQEEHMYKVRQFLETKLTYNKIKVTEESQNRKVLALL